MAKPNDKLFQKDVETLVEASVLQETVNKVSQRFDQALEKLDAQSLEFISAYLSGTTVQDLANSQELSLAEAQAWLARIKREIHQELRTNLKVKQ